MLLPIYHSDALAGTRNAASPRLPFAFFIFSNYLSPSFLHSAECITTFIQNAEKTAIDTDFFVGL